jgi:hypothetical protein
MSSKNDHVTFSAYISRETNDLLYKKFYEAKGRNRKMTMDLFLKQLLYPVGQL